MALYGEGEKEYLLALQIDPENMGCWLDLAECYIEMGRKEKLDEVVQRVLLLSPRSAANHFRMAKIMQKIDKEISIEYWKRYLSIAEQYPLDPNEVAYANIQLISLIGRTN